MNDIILIDLLKNIFYLFIVLKLNLFLNIIIVEIYFLDVFTNVITVLIYSRFIT